MKVAGTILAIMAFTASAAAIADAEAVAQPEARRGHGVKKHAGACTMPGITCGKAKRAADAVAAAIADPEARRHHGACGVPGITCGKARRSLEEVGSALDNVVTTVYTRNPDPEAEARFRHGACGVPGITCGKSKRDADADARRRNGACGNAGITCGKLKRGAELIREADPEHFKHECFSKGGECDTILKAHAAFHKVVAREAEAAAEPIAHRFRACGNPGITCGRDVHDFIASYLAGDEDAKAASEEDTVVQRSLDNLEAKLDAAVAQIYKDD